ncbi:type II toxin-antitoxin system MqsA family antitoxin [Verrucomicrobiaceae bacterium E54]|nr:type II toxin-antitoxin system MqsA family antitoxin [Verrucomicrobiaceae bacterium E54]
MVPTLCDHQVEVAGGKVLTIPEVPMLVCDQCGDRVTGDEGNARINAFLDKALNAISPEEVQQFLAKYGLTQKEAAQITGYGEKNISRWASGRARPSESVSNILRLLLSDEEAFERLRRKDFSSRPKVSYPREHRQPDANEKKVLSAIDYPRLVEMELVQATASPKEKRSEVCKLTKSGDLNELEVHMTRRWQQIAAFKDTRQKFNPVSAGLWSYIGEQRAASIATEPYDRKKLHKAVKSLRELTQHPLADVADQARDILAKAGVALVFVPIMKDCALRGSTRLLTPSKALIIHGLKFRSLSQFWIILFHEIAHLLLHIKSPKDVFTDYEDQDQDEREQNADRWAYDTLASLDRELEFRSKYPKPTIWQLESYAAEIKVHPAIAAEVFNKRAGEDVISYAYLKKKKLFPQLSEIERKALMTSAST